MFDDAKLGVMHVHIHGLMLPCSKEPLPVRRPYKPEQII